MIYIYSAPIKGDIEDVKTYCKMQACAQLSQYIHPSKSYIMSTREEIVANVYRFVIEIDEATEQYKLDIIF